MNQERELDTAVAGTCPSNLDDVALLQLVRQNDEGGCQEFVRRNTGPMLAVARRLLRGEQDAADAVQDAFFAAFRSIHEFQGNARVSTWLHRIVVNACLMKLRHSKTRPVRSIENLLPVFDNTGHHVRRVVAWGELPSDRVQAAELRKTVRACIDQLPDSHRTVLLLRDIEELDTDETASRMGISSAAVKVRLHRARQALRTLLDPILRADEA